MTTLVILPSYNEKDNILQLIDAILDLGSHYWICVVDDNSPDQTAENIVRHQNTMSADRKTRLHLKVRSKKDGRGGAVREGLVWGLQHPSQVFDAFVEMDCDFSHSPQDLLRGTALLKDFDVVLGCRYPDGKIIGWPLKRRVLSFFANFLARVLIAWKIPDYTNGFRFYSRKSAELMSSIPQQHKGYIYLSETLAHFLSQQYRIGTFPIVFVNRERGVSNTHFLEVASAFQGIFQIAWNFHRHR